MFFKKTDWIIIAFFIIGAAAAYFIYAHIHTEGQVRAEIYYYSSLVKTVDLSEANDGFFSLPQNENVVFQISEGGIEFYRSDCPDKICIKSGRLSRAGQSAACLPNGIIIKIVPKKQDGGQVDIVAAR